MDETSIQIKGTGMSRYRAVDCAGKPLEFWLSPTRDAAAAKRFFQRVLRAAPPVAPRVITVEKNAASPKALPELQAVGAVPASCELRQVK